MLELFVSRSELITLFARTTIASRFKSHHSCSPSWAQKQTRATSTRTNQNRGRKHYIVEIGQRWLPLTAHRIVTTTATTTNNRGHCWSRGKTTKTVPYEYSPLHVIVKKLLEDRCSENTLRRQMRAQSTTSSPEQRRNAYAPCTSISGSRLSISSGARACTVHGQNNQVQ